MNPILRPDSFLSRREALSRLGGGFGWVGLASLLHQCGSAALAAEEDSSPSKLHFPAKAKHVIFLFLNGGISQVDTFDPKPMLDKYHGQPLPGGNLKTEGQTGNLMRSPFSFKKYGQSGIEVSEIFPQLGECIDDICVVRSVQTDVPNHESAMFMLHCGHIQTGRPSMGAWMTYGLGTENKNLPGFVVLCPEMPNVVGPPLWGSAFLPATYQGTFVPSKEMEAQKRIQFLLNPHVSLDEQRQQLDLLRALNERQRERFHLRDSQLEGRLEAMETAFRMQTAAPEVFDVTRENRATLELYGEGDFARSCLMARRLVERGVRIVQVFFGKGNPWDHHEDIFLHRKLAAQADRPIAALIKDLKSRGLLDETLVFVASEFGRTPVNQTSGNLKLQSGRDHSHHGFTVLLAGGGVRGGTTYGATDDFGFKAVEKPVHVHDVHATILHQLGMDHERLTFRYSGRDFRLTDVEGHVIKDVLA